MKILNYIKRIVIIFLIIIISYLLQNTFSVYSRNLCINPNILIVITCVFGYMNGSNEGIFVGFISGLLVDIFAADILGVNALLYMYVGFLSGLFNRIFYKDMVYLPLTIIAAGDFLYNFGYYVIRFMLRNKLDFSFYFTKVFVPEIVFTTFIGLLTYKLIYVINEKWLFKEQRSTLNFD